MTTASILETTAFPSRLKQKRRKVGPFAKRLAFGQLDLRTAEGRFAHDVRNALAAQLPGPPNAAQQIMIQMAALKLLRCELLCRKILSAESIQDRHDSHFLAWANSLRRDLEALGIDTQPPAVDPMEAIHRYLASRKTEEAA